MYESQGLIVCNNSNVQLVIYFINLCKWPYTKNPLLSLFLYNRALSLKVKAYFSRMVQYSQNLELKYCTLFLTLSVSVPKL